MEKTMNTAILKICGQGKNSYRKKQDVRHVINYVLDETKREKDDIWNTIGIFGSTKEDFAEDFHRLKRLYGKTDGLQLKHLMLSWGRRPEMPRKKLRILIKKTMGFWGENYQLVYAVHEDNLPDGWHMHIVLNSVSVNGHKIQITQKVLTKFKKKFNGIWNPYGYELCMEQQRKKTDSDKSFECSITAG